MKTMHRQMKKLAFSLVLLAASAAAQTNVTTTGGTANTVPLFTGGSTIGNSLITQSNGGVGIGTTTPGAKLEVDGGNVLINSGLPWSLLSVRSSTVNDIFGVQIDNTATGGTDWRVEQGRSAAGDFNISNCSSGCTQDVVVKPNGNVGIGTTSPAALVHIQGVNDFVTLTSRNGTNASPVQWCGGTYCTYELMTPANGNLYLGPDINGSVNGLAVQPSGNVGIGTTNPLYKLSVNGTIQAK
jgi:hypothetical protein